MPPKKQTAKKKAVKKPSAKSKKKIPQMPSGGPAARNKFRAEHPE